MLARARLSAVWVVVLAGLLSGAACSDSSPPAQVPPVSPATPVEPAVVTPPPISGGTLLVLRDGATAVASDPDRDRIYIVDLTRKTVRATLVLAGRAEPGRAVEDDDGRVHVALRGAGSVATVDSRDGRLLANRPLCPAPRGLAFDAGSKLLHVACAGGELVSIEALAETPARTLRLDRDLRDVVVRGDKLLVTTFRGAELLVVGEAGVEQRHRPSRMRAAFNSSFGSRPFPPGLMAPGGEESFAVPGVAYRMVAGTGGMAMMLHQRSVENEIGTQSNAYGGRSCSGVVEAAVSVYDPTAGATDAIRSGGALANAVLAVDMALAPDGRQVAVVAAGRAGTDQQMTFYSVDEATRPPTAEMPCIPGSPNPMPGTPDEPIEYRPPNGEVIAVAYDPRGNILVQSREPATLQILTQRVAPIVLSDEVRADQGHRLFHTATLGGLACASCHPEGGEDGRVWRFAGLGVRRTQSLRGGIMDTAPFHWNGDMLTFDHLMSDVFQGRMGGGPVERTQMTSLARWIDQVPAIRPSRWHDQAAVERGGPCSRARPRRV